MHLFRAGAVEAQHLDVGQNVRDGDDLVQGDVRREADVDCLCATRRDDVAGTKQVESPATHPDLLPEEQLGELTEVAGRETKIAQCLLPLLCE